MPIWWKSSYCSTNWNCKQLTKFSLKISYYIKHRSTRLSKIYPKISCSTPASQNFTKTHVESSYIRHSPPKESEPPTNNRPQSIDPQNTSCNVQGSVTSLQRSEHMAQLLELRMAPTGNWFNEKRANPPSTLSPRIRKNAPKKGGMGWAVSEAALWSWFFVWGVLKPLEMVQVLPTLPCLLFNSYQLCSSRNCNV